jgi:TonB-dependent starch-binding outer membrane protein SusC
MDKPILKRFLKSTRPIQNLHMIKFYFKKSFLLILLLYCTNVLAQTRVTGKVTSGEDQSGLPGVSILEKGTSNGTVTDAEGNYSISVGDNATLVFSFVGFATQEVPVAGKTTADIILQSDVTALEEIVVIGYGEIQKKDATGAVMNMSSRDFNKGVLTSPQDLIVGKFAGVSVTSNSGAPGSGSTIRIRGGSSLTASNDPLIVIDGFPIDNKGPSGISNQLAAINPNDIETFTVLKDASASAIYGSRAANGVIIITTKKGKAGKMQLSYNGNVSVSTPAKYQDVLTGDEFRELIDELTPTGVAGLNPAAKANLGTANTDWQREIFRSAISHDHNISASGAIKDLPYRVSYGYTDQQGILKTTGLQRHSLNLNLNPSLLNDDLKLNFSVKGSHTTSDFGDAGAVGNAVSFDPTQTVHDESGEYGGYFSWLSRTDPLGNQITNGNSNPVAMLEQTDNEGTSARLIANVLAEYRLPFFKDLTVNVNGGIDQSDSEGFNRSPLDAGFLHSNGTLQGRNNSYTGTNQSLLLDIYGNYLKEIGDHKIDATLGYGWQRFHRKTNAINRNEVISETIPDENENFLVSFFGRLNYNLKGKYLLTATLRADGSSRFSEENRWGLFPSVALAWQLKEENFLTGVDVLSDLKLRAGYGVTGQQDLSDNYYPYLPLYRASNPLAQYQLGDAFYTTQRPEAYDANIKWEETTTYNLGVDFGFFNDNLKGSVEVFQKNTSDLLNFIGIPNGVNFSNFLTTNVGSMRNRGLEITMTATPVVRENMTWSVGANFTSINSEITKLNLTDDPSYPGASRGNVGVGAFIQNDQVGYPAYSFYMYQQVYDTNGKPIEGLYVDRSGQGGTVVGRTENKYRYQKPAADFLIGINSSLRYNQFDFSFSSRLSIGNYVYNNVEAGSAYYNNAYTQMHFRNVPSSVRDTDFINQQTYSDYYVRNASYFKLDNVSAGYSFDKMTDKVKARLSFTVQNAFVITKYNGIDPEVNGGTGDSNGIDRNLYPRPRTFLLGLNVTF